MPGLYIGTSGWNYPHWRNVFYPEGLAQHRWLEHYASVFNCVELNVTFYRTLNPQVFRGWYNRTPKGFGFVVKGPRFITHIKRLKVSPEALAVFLAGVKELKEKALALLWQLPPGFGSDLPRLEAFLRQLVKYRKRQVFEFRQASWFDSKVYSLLERYNACVCIAHSGRFPCERVTTADFLYLRFHGGRAIYASEYGEPELKDWARFIRTQTGKDIFAFFNNDACGYAVSNALQLYQLLQG